MPDSFPSPNASTSTQLWDRKTNGGFPEVKQLKQLVRNVIDPDRDLGHVDRHHKEKGGNEMMEAVNVAIEPEIGGESGEVGVDEGLNAMKQALEENLSASRSPAKKVVSRDGHGRDISKKEDCEDCKYLD